MSTHNLCFFIKIRKNNVYPCKPQFYYTKVRFNGVKIICFCDENSFLFGVTHFIYSLQKHAYSNILKILPSKNENFQIKNSDIFHISAQNIDCGYSLELPRRGGSNEYPQSMFYSRNKILMYTPINPSFTIQKWVLGGQNYIGMFS